MSNDLKNIAHDVSELRTEIEETRREKDQFAARSRPLPDAYDVQRFNRTSRALAEAHATMMAAGNYDWAEGSAVEPILLRYSAAGFGSAGPIEAAVYSGIAELGEECGYWTTRIDYLLHQLDEIEARDKTADPNRFAAQRQKLGLLRLTLAAVLGILSADDPQWVVREMVKSGFFAKLTPQFLQELESQAQKAAA